MGVRHGKEQLYRDVSACKAKEREEEYAAHRFNQTGFADKKC